MSENNINAEKIKIQRIYIKDISFETLNSPHIFRKKWVPEVKLNISNSSSHLESRTFEVVLSFFLTADLEGEKAYVCEVKQAGIFTIDKTDKDIDTAYCLGVCCPSILFPYARECITNLVNRGTFPLPNLSSINFDSLFMNHIHHKDNKTTS
jgi:preprotein translocase subunit SecB